MVLSCWPIMSLRHLGGLLQVFIQLLTGQNNRAVLGSCVTISGSICLNIAHHSSNTPTCYRQGSSYSTFRSFIPNHSPVHGIFISSEAGGRNWRAVLIPQEVLLKLMLYVYFRTPRPQIYLCHFSLHFCCCSHTLELLCCLRKGVVRKKEGVLGELK